MRIRRFSFLGIRGLDGLKQDLPRTKDTDLVLVHGRYARGKTTFLDTLAAAKELIASYGMPDGRWAALPGSSSGAAKVQIDWETSDAERARIGTGETTLSTESILGKALLPPDVPKLAQALLSEAGDAERGSIHYLHDSRELTAPLSHGADASALSQRLTTRNSKFSILYDVLDQSERGAARALASSRFSELFPHLEIGGLRRSGVSFVPTARHRASGAERSYGELSSSERQAFLIALYVSSSPIVDSILMVDAPELGFGDEGAVDLVRAMLRWTQRTQLVVATASREVRALPEVAHVVELPS